MERKTKVLLGGIAFILAVSFGFNVFLLIKGKINYTKNEYITTNSRADSYANSGSVAIGYIGDMQGKWDIVTLIAHDTDELDKMLKSLSPAQFCFAKIVEDNIGSRVRTYRIIFPEMADKREVKQGETKTKYEERLNVK